MTSAPSNRPAEGLAKAAERTFAPAAFTPEQEDELSPRSSQTLPCIGYAGRRVFPHKTADISGATR